MRIQTKNGNEMASQAAWIIGNASVAGHCVVRKRHPNELCTGPLYADDARIVSALLKSARIEYERI